MSLTTHTESIRTKCIRKLNILKCLSFKNWSHGVKQQLTIYKSLIRSCIEYAAPVLVVNQKNIDRLHGVQYQALKIIAKDFSEDCSSQYLHDLFEIQSLNDRLRALAKNYFKSAVLGKNPIIIELMNDMTFSSGRKSNPIEVSWSVA
jgi:hypothetical protein